MKNVCNLMTPADNAVVCLQTPAQLAFAKSRREAVPGADGVLPAIDWLHLERSGKEDLTFPVIVEFTWSGDGEALFELAEDAEFSRIVRAKAVRGGRIAVENLKIAQTYFWRVNDCAPRSFNTKDAAPRWMRADGCSNIRDCGGWKALDGRRIKQGMLYRGSELDIHHTVTEEGIRAFREDMRITTDLDIRGEVLGKRFTSEMGGDVRFMNIPAVAYAKFLEEKDVCKHLFDVLCDEASYPVYFHCWGGADRTGTLALLIGAVLGMSDEELILDYELTSLSIWGDRRRDSELFSGLMEALTAYPGATLGERAAAFLDVCGVDAAMQEKLRQILLEE